MNETIEANVTGCSRCGEYHKQLVFKKFTNPIDDTNGKWTHWATCPTTGDPVLMRIVDDDDGEG
jgi:hypothetical protein